MTLANPHYNSKDLVDHHAIAAILHDKDGKYLMFFHRKFEFWTIPIGKAEPGETPYEGMCTEMREECDIRVTEATEITNRQYNYIRQGKPVSVNLHLYRVNQFTGVPKNNEPHKHPEMKFMTLNEIKALNNVSDATLLLLETI